MKKSHSFIFNKTQDNFLKLFPHENKQILHNLKDISTIYYYKQSLLIKHNIINYILYYIIITEEAHNHEQNVWKIINIFHNIFIL